MNKKILTDTLGWGSFLWLIGYLLGILLFFFIPPSLLGWIITPIGILITLLVLFKKIKSHAVSYYLMLSVSWTVLAIILDYFLLVKVFNPPDGYYKLDVYFYYSFTFLLPLIVGFYKSAKLK